MPGAWKERSAAATICCLLLLVLVLVLLLLLLRLLSSAPARAGQELEVGTCEITALDRDLSHPRRTIARQTARCACRHGQVAGTARAKPACVDARLVASRQWCGMEPCEEGEQCALLRNRSGWSCTRQLGRIKTITVS